MAGCNNRCRALKIPKPFREKVYANGLKRCNTCSIYLYHKGHYCPCCGYNFGQAHEPAELISVKKNDKLVKNN